MFVCACDLRLEVHVGVCVWFRDTRLCVKSHKDNANCLTNKPARDKAKSSDNCSDLHKHPKANETKGSYLLQKRAQ